MQNKDLKMVLFFYGNEWVIQMKDLGWVQHLENLKVVIRMKSFGKCSQM